MKLKNEVILGIKAMSQIVPGVIPFGLIMGTVASNASLNVVELTGLNVFIFAGASQLIAVDLMTKNVESFIIILTGLVINLRMMLYSASFSSLFKDSSLITKTLGSYFLTDQAYAVYASTDIREKSRNEKIVYYLSSAIFMWLSWNFFVALGFVFGNFAPTSLALDFAVPLSFVALMIPTLKNHKYYYVSVCSGLLSIVFHSMPYNLGLLVAAGISLCLGAFLTRTKKGESK